MIEKAVNWDNIKKCLLYEIKCVFFFLNFVYLKHFNSIFYVKRFFFLRSDFLCLHTSVRFTIFTLKINFFN